MCDETHWGHELGVESGSSHDQVAEGAIADDREVVEDREDVADALRSDMKDIVVGKPRQKRIEDSNNADNEDTVGCTRTLEKTQILRTARSSRWKLITVY